jgi:hypothetical protein
MFFGQKNTEIELHKFKSCSFHYTVLSEVDSNNINTRMVQA